MKRMKLEGEVVFEMRNMKLHRCTRPDLDCVWSLTREELLKTEVIAGRSVSYIPQFEGSICNCNPIFEPAVKEARRIGCGLLK